MWTFQYITIQKRAPNKLCKQSLVLNYNKDVNITLALKVKSHQKSHETHPWQAIMNTIHKKLYGIKDHKDPLTSYYERIIRNPWQAIKHNI